MSDDNSTRRTIRFWGAVISVLLIASMVQVRAFHRDFQCARAETRYARPMPTLDYTGGATEEGISDEWK